MTKCNKGGKVVLSVNGKKTRVVIYERPPTDNKHKFQLSDNRDSRSHTVDKSIRYRIKFLYKQTKMKEKIALFSMQTNVF